MTDNGLIVAVVLNWNNREDTVECLKSNRRSGYAFLKTVVIDQGSTDGSGELISREFPEVLLIQNKENVGHSKGNNIGIRKAAELGAEYVFLQDNDTLVDPGIFYELKKAIDDDPSCGIAGPLVLCADPPDTIWCGGGMIKKKSFQHIHLYEGRKFNGNSLAPGTVDFMPSCGLLVRREVFSKIGDFDEKLFLYHNDVDFCLRAGQSGYTVRFCPSAKMWHKVSSTVKPYSPFMIYYKGRNKLILFKRYGRMMHFPFFVGFHLKKAARILWDRKDLKSIAALFRAAKDFMFMRTK